MGLASYLCLRLVQELTRRQLRRLAQRTASAVDDLLIHVLERRTHRLFVAVVSAYAGSLALELPVRLQTTVRAAALIALFAQVAWWANGAIGYWFEESYRRQKERDADSSSTYYLLALLSRVGLWSIVALAALHNLGMNMDVQQAINLDVNRRFAEEGSSSPIRPTPSMLVSAQPAARAVHLAQREAS